MSENKNKLFDQAFPLLIAGIFTTLYGIFSIIFFMPINFQASFIKISLYSIPLFVLKYFLLNKYISSKTDGVKSPRAFKFFFLLLFHGFSYGSLNAMNQLLDKSEIKIEKLVLLDKDLESTKRGLIYKGFILIPVKTSFAFLPESYDSIYLTKEEYQSMVPGKAYIQIKYKMGLFNIPYIIESKTLRWKKS